jgi:hypothetical protein
MSDDLERRLQDTLRVQDTLRGDRLPDAPQTVRSFLERLPAEAEERPREKRFGLAWLASVPAIVVVAALLFVLLPRNNGPQATSPSPLASGTPLQGIRWSSVASTGSSVLVDGDTVMSAIAYGGGYVLVGNAQRADHAAWWYSPDGTTWQRHDTDPVFTDSLLQQIVRIPDGLLIVGTANHLDAACAGGVFGCQPSMPLRMWTSSDGRTWERLPDADLAVFGRAGLTDAVSGPAGIVAVGAQLAPEGGGVGMIWTSPDGRTWEAASQFFNAFPGTVPTNVVVIGRTYVAIGYRVASDGSAAGPAAWYSTDARTWQAASGAEFVGDWLLGSQRGALSIALREPPAVGLAGAALALTDDGSAWRADVALNPWGFGDNGPTLLSDGSRILAMATRSTGGGRGAWLSIDAQHWQAVPQMGELPPLDRIGAVGALGPDGVVVVTTTTTPSTGFTISIWFGSFAMTPSPTPGPSATSSVPPSAGTPVYLAGASRIGDALWAIHGSGWLMSSNAGVSWQEHPMPVAANKVLTATAVDATHAWLVSIGAGSTEVTGSLTDVLRYEVWQTSDGGATWHSVTVPGSYPAHTPVLSFIDAQRGYLLAAEQRFSDGVSNVLGTSDGGMTWSQVGAADSLGSEFTTSDASTLWAGGEAEAGPVVHPAFEVSRDSGRTWADVALPGITAHQEGGPMVYLAGPPVFLTPQSGALAVTIENTPVTHTAIYRTTDSGGTWTLASDLPVEASSGLALVDETHWFLPVDNPFGLLSGANAGGSWQRVATSRLANGGWLVWIGALEGGTLAATIPSGHSYPGSVLLFVSADGGHTWQPQL